MVKLAIDLKVANLAELCIVGTRVLADSNHYRTWTTEPSGEVREDQITSGKTGRRLRFHRTALPAWVWYPLIAD